MKRWAREWWWGLVSDWHGWRSGEANWWQALWGHNVKPWWKVPGFMKRWRNPSDYKYRFYLPNELRYVNISGDQLEQELKRLMAEPVPPDEPPKTDD